MREWPSLSANNVSALMWIRTVLLLLFISHRGQSLVMLERRQPNGWSFFLLGTRLPALLVFARLSNSFHLAVSPSAANIRARYVRSVPTRTIFFLSVFFILFFSPRSQRTTFFAQSTSGSGMLFLGVLVPKKGDVGILGK